MNLRLCLLTAIYIMAGFLSQSMALTGKWRGELNLGATKLPLVFNFSESSDGETLATMDSPQQNATGIALEVKHCSSDSISLECKMIGASYNGKITNDRIEGQFRQYGYTFPLVLIPEEDISIRRPQTPKPPFPYIEKDTTFISFDGTELAGTLTLPDIHGGKTFTAVVMVTGSGPQNRDEEIFEHRPFAVIADYLARNGIASFRYDDRGTAESKGNYSEATIDTFKEDLKSAYRFTKGLKDTGKTGILGHSEGGTLAILLGAEESPDFIVSLAGMVVPAKETLLAQNIHLLERLGLSENQKEASIRLIDLFFNEIIRQHVAGTSSPIDIDSICRDNSLIVPFAVLQSIKHNNSSRNGYYDSLVSLDPTDALESVRCPVLALNGTKDLQVNANANLNAFMESVSNVEVRRMEGLNHLFQNADTGEVTEYDEIKETISPEVLSIITDFIKKQ